MRGDTVAKDAIGVNAVLPTVCHAEEGGSGGGTESRAGGLFSLAERIGWDENCSNLPYSTQVFDSTYLAPTDVDRDHLDIDRVLRETFVVDVQHHATLDSTNDRARRCAAETSGELPLLVIADRQTAGRGRGTNRWWTGRGSLAMTLLLTRDQVGVRQVGQSPLVALATALAVADTLAPLLPGRRVGIRWPNDVFADGGKLAGILVEVLPDGRHIVGIGVNTNNSLADAPPELRTTAATLYDLTGRHHDRTTFLVELLSHLEDALGQSTSEPDRIGARANRLCLQHGETLTVEQGRRTIRGRCAGIAPDGALLLETDDGRQSFYSGVLL